MSKLRKYVLTATFVAQALLAVNSNAQQLPPLTDLAFDARISET